MENKNDMVTLSLNELMTNFMFNLSMCTNNDEFIRKACIYIDFVCIEVKKLNINSVPEWLTESKAIKYLKKQYSSSGMLYPTQYVNKGIDSGRLDKIMERDMVRKVHSELIRIHTELKKNNLIGLQTVNVSRRLLDLQGGMGFQLMSKDNPYFKQ